jgi:hypothetical protein
MRKLLAFALLLACASVAKAQTNCAGLATCNLTSTDMATSTAFQTALNTVNQDPATVNVPTGTFTWTVNTVNVTFTRSITIAGAGAISSTTGGASTTGSDLTTIMDNFSGSSHVFIVFNTSPGKSLRITGIAFGTNGSSSNSLGELVIAGTSTSVRVDHCHFITTVDSKGLYIQGTVLGVANNDFFDVQAGVNPNNSFVVENGAGWNGVSDSGFADASWIDGDHFGTSQFFFVEDSRFSNGYTSDCSNGGRYVFRHNTALNVFGMANHGLSSSRVRGCRAAEIYDNTFTASSGAQQGNIYGMNSGSLLFWGNTSTWYRYMLQTDVVRKNNTTYPETVPPGGWGYCGTSFNGTGSAWDGSSSSSTGYPCMDQPGRGTGDFLSGNFSTVCNKTLNPACNVFTGQYPRQAIDPLYIFANTYNPAGFSPESIIADSSGRVSDNQDYYLQYLATYGEPGSNCTGSPCNITAGVNQTTRDPVNGVDTCTAGPGGNTPGVGWWNSTSSKLWVCNPTNNWGSAAYYQPYTYPWVAGGGSTPANTPTFVPVAGVYSSAQSVTISTTAGSLICYNNTGAAIAIGGVSTCPAGSTKYTSPVSVPSSQTLYAVAGGVGFTDSSTASAAYTISPPVATYTPSSIAFTPTLVNQSSAATSATLKNTGISTLVVSSFTLTNNKYYVINNTCGTPATLVFGGAVASFSLSVSASCTFSVVYLPQSVNNADAGGVIAIDNTAGGSDTLSLSGIGVISPTDTSQFF